MVFINSRTYICEIDHQGQFYYNTNHNSTSMAKGIVGPELKDKEIIVIVSSIIIDTSGNFLVRKFAQIYVL